MDKILDWFEELGKAGHFFRFCTAAVIAVIAVLLANHFIKKFFKLRPDAGNKIQVRFLENTLRLVVILFALFWVLMSTEETAGVGRLLFQGSALLTAVLGFAAQPVISDLICGFIISSSRPFELGDRIELDNGTKGIVKDLTMRHVVIRGLDTIDIIIPNSRINSMTITNMSRTHSFRSFSFRIGVAYDTDIAKASSIISKQVRESEYTVPGYPGKEGMEYGRVYFLSYEESSLTLACTVYYEPSSATEIVQNDINCRIHTAFAENGIEIPYNYMNVVVTDRKNAAADRDMTVTVRKNPAAERDLQE